MNSTATPTAGADRSRTAAGFRRFADAECGDEPLYKALCEIAQREPQLLGLLDAASAEQRRPNLLLAAVHHLLLGGARHRLASYYPSVDGTRAADDELHRVFVDFCDTHRQALTELIATHTTQTNEVGRCAVLWPALRLAAQQRGADRIALLDFGASAGLNLGVDRYGYDYGRFGMSPGGAGTTVTMACRLVGDKAPPAGDGDTPRIVSRLGVDMEAVDVHDKNAVRWLRACLWPSDEARAHRFDAAVDLAREAGWRVQTHADCTSAVVDWARAVPSDVLPVLVNSWVLTYVPREARAQHIARMRSLVQERDMAWISAEAPEILIDEQLVPPPVDAAHADLGPGSLWTLMRRGETGPSAQFIARSHPHGKWMQWLA